MHARNAQNAPPKRRPSERKSDAKEGTTRNDLRPLQIRNGTSHFLNSPPCRDPRHQRHQLILPAAFHAEAATNQVRWACHSSTCA
eukprot:13451929-Alexandrium_andersonii.AAC.1